MANPIKREEVKEIHLLREDGSVWEAELDESGNIVLVKELRPPVSKSKAPEPESSSETPESEEEEKLEPSPSEPEEAPEEPEKEPEGEEEAPAGGSGEGEESEEEAPEPEEPEPSAYEDIEPEESLEDLLGEVERSEEGGGAGATREESFRKDQPEYIDPMPDHVKDMVKDSAFRARLSSVMLDNKYDRMLKGRTRGKLDMTRLYKVPTEARSVFKQKQARRGKSYNVMLVVDESGSMSGDKAERAAECAVFLAKAFEGININVAIIGFNAYITTRKEFEGKADYDRIYEAIRTMNFHRGSGDNNDWDALNKAYHMFDKAPEGENILIMLSDGQPATDDYDRRFIDIKGNEEEPPKGTDRLDGWQKNQKEHLHHLVKANDHRVKSIGIGIMMGGWQIPDHTVVNNVNELKSAIITQLRKHIKRG